jgi:hypothetical protein
MRLAVCLPRFDFLAQIRFGCYFYAILLNFDMRLAVRLPHVIFSCSVFAATKNKWAAALFYSSGAILLVKV